MRILVKSTLVAAVLGSFAFAQEPGPAPVKMEPSCDLRMGMRKLWEEHIAYTRNFIISTLAGLPDTDSVVQRLLKNQDDLGTAIEPYYGEAARKQLAALLRDHILIAADVLKAAQAGSNDRLAEQQKRWTANGVEIAAFLSGANPHWSRKALEEMLQKHLDLTTREVTARLNKDWAADIKAYDEGHEHMLMFSDMLVEGIRRQFPAQFGG